MRRKIEASGTGSLIRLRRRETAGVENPSFPMAERKPFRFFEPLVGFFPIPPAGRPAYPFTMKPPRENPKTIQVHSTAENTEWVVFRFHASPGAQVHVAGSFNGWDATAIKLDDDGHGTYSTTMHLPLGRYEYKFVVNGDWCNGPDIHERVPNVFGTTNSVVVVSRADTHHAHLHTFARTSDHHEQMLVGAMAGE
jgi:hypothetical protein